MLIMDNMLIRCGRPIRLSRWLSKVSEMWEWCLTTTALLPFHIGACQSRCSKFYVILGRNMKSSLEMIKMDKDGRLGVPLGHYPGCVWHVFGILKADRCSEVCREKIGGCRCRCSKTRMWSLIYIALFYFFTIASKNVRYSQVLPFY